MVLVSGAVLSLAFPAPDIAPLAWVSLVPLVMAVEDGSGGRAAALGFTFGVAFFGTLLVWVSLVGWVAWAALVLIESLFLGLFGALAWAAARVRLPVLQILGVVAAWIACEYLRASMPVGGFTWGQLVQSQHDLTWLLRSAAWGGGWAVTAILVAANTLVVRSIRDRSWMPVAIAAGLMAAPLMLPQNSAGGDTLDVAIVQGNVPPQDFPGGPVARELRITLDHAELTEELAGTGVDLVVWPESSLGLDLAKVPAIADAVARAARAAAAPIIAGGNLDVGVDRYRVMAFYVDATGQVTDRYQKTHLVPFGEYIPARSLIDWIPMLDQVPRDAIPGTERVLFTFNGGRKIAPVISFESDFGSLVRERIAAGARMLVVATNTSTWGRTWASAQHLAFSQVRAVENGVWVVHAAITGISGFVAPDGTVADRTAMWRPTTITQSVRLADGPTFYARTGDWLAWASLAGAVALAVSGLRRRRRPAVVT